MLNEYEKNALIPIIEQVLITVQEYDNFYKGFQVFITGSSLNLVNREYNDIDLMVVIPENELKRSKGDILSDIWEYFKNKDITRLRALMKEKRIELFNLNESVEQMIDNIDYIFALDTCDQQLLLKRLGSMNEVNRQLLDPAFEIQKIKMHAEGILEEERARPAVESDSTLGYQFGPLVEKFLRDAALRFTRTAKDGRPWCSINWHKSFSEGYGKTAGENNIHIYSRAQCVPVHLFLTTGVDNKKAMEKKESFMIEYYQDNERLPPIRIY